MKDWKTDSTTPYKHFNVFDRQSKEEGKKTEVKKMEKKRGWYKEAELFLVILNFEQNYLPGKDNLLLGMALRSWSRLFDPKLLHPDMWNSAFLFFYVLYFFSVLEQVFAVPTSLSLEL